MTRDKLTTLIDRVIGKNGIMRASAWWVRRLLNNLMAYTDNAVKNVKIEVDDALSESSENPVKNSVITSEILANEKVTAEALVDLNNRLSEIVERLNNAGL